MATVAELGAKIRAKYPGQYDDMDDATIGAKAKAKYPEYADFTDAPTAAPMQGVAAGASSATAVPPQLTMLEQGIQALPAIGGIVGDLLTTPLKLAGPAGYAASAAGGAAGQASGELGRQAFSGPPGIENPAAIGTEAIKGGAFSLAGGLTGRAINGVARGAFAAGGKVAPKIANTLMKYGVNVSAGRFGAQKLAAVGDKLNKGARALYSEADQQVGKTLPVRELTDAIRAQAAKLPNKFERRSFEKLAAKYDRGHSAYVTPSEMRIMKQRAQNLVNYKGEKIGPKAQEFNRTIAGVARTKLTGLGEIGKKIARADDELGRIKDAKRVLARASNRVPGAGAGALQPVAGLVDHPQLYSTLALLLNSTKGAANVGTRTVGNLVLPPAAEE